MWNMRKFNLIVYTVAMVASLYDAYIANNDFARVGWMCSAIWAFNALMLQFEVNRLKRDNDEEE
jgi:hypothetical protein